MIIIPHIHKYLVSEPGPKMLTHALRLVGTREIAGTAHNPVILSWAKQLGVEGIYKADETPWCGLAHAFVAMKTGKPYLTGYDMLRALRWVSWGKAAVMPMLGDTLIFQRPGGGHVGLYVGEDDQCYHVLGGNQSNAYGFTRIVKDRLYAARRPEYSIQPANVRRIFLNGSGPVSHNEA